MLPVHASNSAFEMLPSTTCVSMDAKLAFPPYVLKYPASSPADTLPPPSESADAKLPVYASNSASDKLPSPSLSSDSKLPLPPYTLWYDSSSPTDTRPSPLVSADPMLPVHASNSAFEMLPSTACVSMDAKLAFPPYVLWYPASSPADTLPPPSESADAKLPV